MPVLVAVVVASIVVTVVLAWVTRLERTGDPADVRVESGGLVEQARRHPPLRRFLLARRDTTRATGLLLTLALAATASSTLVVGLVLDMVQTRRGFARWDDAAARWGAAHTTGAAEAVVRVVTQAGSSPVIVSVCVITAILENRRIPNRAAPAFLAAVAASELVANNLVKVIVGRERPDVARLVEAAGFSFPSGHTASTAAVYAAVALLVGRRRGRRAKALLAGAAGGITVAVAVSRVLLGAHWLTDVIAGAALGWACFALCSIAFGGRLMHFGQPVEEANATLSNETGHRADPVVSNTRSRP